MFHSRVFVQCDSGAIGTGKQVMHSLSAPPRGDVMTILLSPREKPHTFVALPRSDICGFVIILVVSLNSVQHICTIARILGQK